MEDGGGSGPHPRGGPGGLSLLVDHGTRGLLRRDGLHFVQGVYYCSLIVTGIGLTNFDEVTEAWRMVVVAVHVQEVVQGGPLLLP